MAISEITAIGANANMLASIHQENNVSFVFKNSKGTLIYGTEISQKEFAKGLESKWVVNLVMKAKEFGFKPEAIETILGNLKKLI